jgi:YmgG-like glycine-zipper protein
MSKYIRRLTPLALTVALGVAACSKGENKSDTALAQDSSLNRDLQLATGDSAAQPQLKDVPPPPEPAPPAPAASTPRPKPKPTPKPTTPAPKAESTPPRTASGNTVTPGEKSSAGNVGMIASGTSLNLASTSKVCTNTNKVGDRFTATLSEPVTGSNGAVIPAGANAVIEVTKLKRSENANDNIEMGFAVRTISFGGTTYNVDADVTTASVDRVRASTKGNDAKKVAGGAVIGAVLGQVIGKDTKGTVIGAAAGAAAGTAAAATTANYEGCVNEGGRIVIKLTSPLSIKAA